MSQTYTYTAQGNTGYYITSTPCDVADQIVATANGNSGAVPAGATLTFNKPLQSVNITDVTIKGINGLYVALPPNPKTGDKLVWSTEATNWVINPTSTTDVYVIIPQGLDLYWFTDNSIGPIVQVKKGLEVKGKENQWTLKKVE